MFNFIKNIGPTEIAVIVIILIVFFGGKVIIGLARTSGETVREIKNIKKTFTRAIEDDTNESDKK